MNVAWWLQEKYATTLAKWNKYVYRESDHVVLCEHLLLASGFDGSDNLVASQLIGYENLW